MSTINKPWLAPMLLALAALTACGGGGGNTSSGNSSNPVTTAPVVTQQSPALTFNPGTVIGKADAGQSATLNVDATVNRPGDFNGNVFASVVDTTGVLLPSARFISNSPTQYTAVLQTSAALAPGNYKGTFTVNLCKDSGCAQHYPGSPMSLPYEITVAPAVSKLSATWPIGALNLTVNAGAALAPVTISVKGQQMAWSATTSTSWIKLAGASGSGDGSFTIGFDLSGIAAPANVTGEVLLTGSEGQRFPIPVALNVMRGSFVVDHDSYTFNAVNGAPIEAQTLKFSLDKGGNNWTAKPSAAWLQVNPGSGILPGSLTVTPDASKGALASATYKGAITLSAAGVQDMQLPVTLNLSKATLNLSANSIVLGGAYGRDALPATLSMNLNTQKNSWPWTLDTAPVWLTLSARSGSVNQDGTSITLAPNVAQLPVGSTSTVLNATVRVNGDTLSKPIAVTANRDQIKVLPSDVGVALVSVPGWSRLTQTVTVSDNFNQGVAWSASADRSWLQVERSGNALKLSADASGLPLDSISYATVTLSSSAAATPEKVRVAVWKGSKTPAAKTVLTTRYTRVLADPIRPLVYVHAGGSTLDVYNIYTGAKIATSGALGAILSDMAMSPNGDHLFVHDAGNANVQVVDPLTLTRQATYNLTTSTGSGTHLLPIRPNGVELLLTNTGSAFRVADNTRLKFDVGGTMSATANGKRLFAQNEGLSPASVYAYDVDYSEVGGGTLFVKQTATGWSVNNASNGRDIAVSADGSHLYTASGAPYRCGNVDPVSLAGLGLLTGGDAYPNNVKVDRQGRVFCGISGWYSTADVWLHDSNGTLLKSFKFAGYARELLARQMAVSGDGMVLVGLTDDPLLAIIAVGP